MMPIVSKTFCSSLQTTLIVRKRPAIVNGGGFVVTNPNQQEVIFTVDGCGTLGVDRQLIVRDADRNSILLIIRKKEGLLQALSMNYCWRGQIMDYQVPSEIVFSLKEPKWYNFVNKKIRISIEPKEYYERSWDFEVQGSFSKRSCCINDRRGNVIAQVGLVEDTTTAMAGKEVYRVMVRPGYDQAFVIGVIAVLDYVNGESTTC